MLPATGNVCGFAFWYVLYVLKAVSAEHQPTRLHNDLRFNTADGTASSTGVNTKAARLLVCILDAADVPPAGSTMSVSVSSATPCEWSEEQTQTYLSGCTADLCFQCVLLQQGFRCCFTFRARK